jgi:hypothetical protein
MGFLLLVVVGVILIFVIVGVISSKISSKKGDNKEAALIKKIEEGDKQSIIDLAEHYSSRYLGQSQDLCKIIKIYEEAAERGASYLSAVERAINNRFSAYLVTLDIRKTLDKAGYKTGPNNFVDYNQDHKYVYFSILDSAGNIQGSVNFSMTSIVRDNAKTGLYHEKCQHMICLNKIPIVITSNAPCLDPPPDWMVICAKVLANNYNELSSPEWINMYPNAHEYINVAFR